MLEDLDNMMALDSEELTKSYTDALLKQCTSINDQLTEIVPNFLQLLTIQATYDAFKYQVSKVIDLETQKQIFKVIEFDAKNLVFPVEPTVDYIGNA